MVNLAIALAGIRAYVQLPLAASSTLRGWRMRYSRCLHSAIRCDEGQPRRETIDFSRATTGRWSGGRPRV